LIILQTNTKTSSNDFELLKQTKTLNGLSFFSVFDAAEQAVGYGE